MRTIVLYSGWVSPSGSVQWSKPLERASGVDVIRTFRHFMDWSREMKLVPCYEQGLLCWRRDSLLRTIVMHKRWQVHFVNRNPKRGYRLEQIFAARVMAERWGNEHS